MTQTSLPAQDVDSNLSAQWSQQDLQDELTRDTLDSDVTVLRVLAARIATRAGDLADAVLVDDLCHAVSSLAVAVRAIAEEKAEPEEADEAGRIGDAMDRAARALGDLTGWF